MRHTISFPENALILIFTAVNLARMGMIAYLATFNSQWFQLIYIYVKEKVNLREKAVRYHDQTGGKFSRFESSDAHFR
jgi:hypothetical protein